MSRIVPFDKNEKCDNCGEQRAFDFMGYFLCGACSKCAIEGWHCQRYEECKKACDKQCDHCKEYYKPIEQ